ncbi:nucleoside recognition domain-containing protein [Bowmanella denitrificans]|uniref:nucleoside recognition domain-containing protein n=1 Tax=Bowmanella denitrificans TaxID=366582 RepID=UPI000C9A3D24|nr:nucleoside recognition domain-containing protein [Bowmanella denitrificans]
MFSRFPHLQPTLAGIAQDIGRAYWTLIKIMLPATIAVKLLDSLGFTQWLGVALGPVMELLGLPSELGLVWAVTMLTNIYTGMAAFYTLSVGQEYTVAQISILGLLMLVAHSLVIEGAVAKATGVRWRLTLAVRIGSGLILAVLFSQIFSHFGLLQQPAQLMWQPQVSEPGWLGWGLAQLKLLAWIFVILSSLVVMMRVLRWLGVERVLQQLLSPLMRCLTIGKEASNITIIGMLLGLSYGAGLLINEVRSGHISKRDTLLVVCFLGLCHSLIEDTLLILLLGADLSTILWGRVIFAIALITAMGRIWLKSRHCPDPLPNPDS